MKDIKLAIVGSRNFNNYSTVFTEIFKLHESYNIIKIVSGGAKGADKLAEQYAQELNIPTKIIYADWDTYGKRAGYIRNKLIWDEVDLIIAFWDGESKGTKHTIDKFKDSNKIITIMI